MTENQKTLKKLMIDAEVNQLSLSRRIPCSARFIGQLLHGERQSKRIKAQVARILGISPDELTRLIGP
jgi:hypothetical protein